MHINKHPQKAHKPSLAIKTFIVFSVSWLCQHGNNHCYMWAMVIEICKCEKCYQSKRDAS